YWGQMVPYSHPADVAMGVLLPSLLLLTFGFLRASERRESRFYLAATLTLALALIVAHPREIVQFLVYLTAVAAVVFIARGPQPLAKRAAIVVCCGAVLLLGYRFWYEASARLFIARGLTIQNYALVVENRSELQQLFMNSSWR